MSKLKKVLLMCTAYVLVAALAIGGTIAYLQDSDSDVNVMTLGNVKIEQHEYEREVDVDGNYATKTIDNVTSYVLKDFTQGKPLLPIVGDPNEPGSSPAYAGYDDTIVRMTQVDSYGSMQVFAGKNAQDKFVTVENTGETDAYVRTLVAIENGTGDANLIGIGSRCVPAADAATSTAPWVSNYIGQITFDGNTYGLYEYVYRGASDVNRHVNGVLPAGDTTYPNLCQVYLKHNATNEDMVAIDGNNNGTLDILVLSQAVQVAGFADAKTALDTAFGKASDEAAEWFNGIAIPEMVQGDIVSSSTSYGYSVANGESVVFDDVDLTTSGGGINIQGTAVFNSGSVVNDSTSPNPRHMFYVAARENVANGHLTINDGEFTFSPSNLTRKGYYICADGEGAVVIVNGGTFGKPSTRDNYKAGIGELNGGEVIIKGGTFGFDPTNWVADGYEAVQNGNTWTVVAK